MKLKKGTLLFLLLTCLAYTTLAQTEYKLDGNDVTIDDDGMITSCRYNFSANTVGTQLIIPKSVTKDSETITIKGINDKWPGIFMDKNLHSLTFADGSEVTTIGNNAFQDNSITSLTLPNSITTIGGAAFDKNNIETLNLPNSITTIGGGAFKYNNIEILNLPASLTTIRGNAFSENKLTSVTFQSNSKIQSIESDAFASNSGLTSITLPQHAHGSDILRYKDSEGNEYQQGQSFMEFARSLVIVLPSHTLTASDVDINDQGVITQCHCDNFFSRDIIIPKDIGNKTVTEIDDNAFQQKNLTAVSFEPGSEVTSIGQSAFAYNNIETLTLPNTLTSIYSRAFRGNELTSVTLPNSISTISHFAFSYNNIETLNLPNSITTIEYGAFSNNNIETLNLPNSITTIEYSAFDDNNIETLNLPNSITTIEYSAFDDNNIETLNLPNSLTTIGYGAFKDNNIETLNLPNSLTTIGNNVFERNNIKTLNLPASLTTIGGDAFRQNKLTSVTFQSNSKIQRIGGGAFASNSGLASITLPQHAHGSDILRYKDSEGNEYHQGQSFMEFARSLVIVLPSHTLTASDVDIDDQGGITQCHCDNFSSRDIIIPKDIGNKTVTRIGNNAFQQKNLTVVTFEAGSEVTSIGQSAFAYNNIETLTLPDALTTIGYYAFSDNEITSLTLPNSLITIGSHAFRNNNIETLTLPDALTTIGYYAFSDNEITSLTLPNSLITIGSDAFEGNNIKTLTLPNSLITIYSGAFGGNELTSVTFMLDVNNKSNIQEIRSDAFSNNAGLTSITLPPNTMGSGGGAYKDSEDKVYQPGDLFSEFSRSLSVIHPPYTLTWNDISINEQGVITECKFDNFLSRNIIIPKSVNKPLDGGGFEPITITRIEGGFEEKGLIHLAFADDSEVTTIEEGTFADNYIYNLLLPASVVTIGKDAFAGNNMETLNLPEGINTIGAFAFHNNNIKTLDLPEGINTIGSGAFDKNNIETLNLPNFLTTIGYRAFNDNKLTEVTFMLDVNNKSNIREIGSSAFSSNDGLTSITLPPNTMIYKDSKGKVYQPGETFSEFTRRLFVIHPPYTLTWNDITIDEQGVITKCNCDNFLSRNIIIPKAVNKPLDEGGVEPITIKGIRNETPGVFQEKKIETLTFTDDSEVTWIGNQAFAYNYIYNLLLPASVVTIGDWAFDKNNIKTLNLPEGINTIGDWAFSWNNIKTLDLPEGINTIGAFAFGENNMETLNLAASLISIGESAFGDNELKTVTFSTDENNKSNIQEIGAKAFSNNDELTSITLPHNTMGSGGDEYKDSEGKVYQSDDSFSEFSRTLFAIPSPYTLTWNDITIDEQGVITECKCDNSLRRNIIIPKAVNKPLDGGGVKPITITRIEGGFEEKKLIHLDFADDSEVTTIGYNTFRNNYLTTLSLPASVATIGDNAFSNNNIQTLNLPEGITTIGEDAFSWNNIETLNLPASLISIGESAFGSNKLTSVTFMLDVNNKSNIQEIGSGTFTFNNELTTITLPQNTIGSGGDEYKDSEGKVYQPGDSFSEFSRRLSVIYPPYTLTWNDISINEQGVITKCNCNNFLSRNIIIPKAVNKPLDEGGVEPITIKRIGSRSTGVFHKKKLIHLDFADDSEVTTIGYNAFKDNYLITLSLPASVVTIGDNAFINNNIKTLNLPASLISIGESTFSANELKTVTFRTDENNKSNIREIESNAFSNNDELTSITLPHNTMESGGGGYKDSEGRVYQPDDSFSEFTRRLSIIYPPYTLTWNDISIDEQGVITKCNCDNFQSRNIIIPKAVDKPLDGGGVEPITIKGIQGSNYIGVFQQKNIETLTFADDSEMTSIGDNAFINNNIQILNLPEGITTIGENAFSRNNIETLNLPNFLTTIGYRAFNDNELTEVTFMLDVNNKSNIQEIGSSAFSNNDELTSITLPHNTMESGGGEYKDSEGKIYQPGETFSEFNRGLFVIHPPYTLTWNDITIDEQGVITKCNCDNFLSRNIIIPKAVDKPLDGGGVEPITIKGIQGSNYIGVFQQKNIETLTFANDSEVISIGLWAFKYNNLDNISLPASVVTIGGSAFKYNNIKTLNLPEGITTIGEDAFSRNNIETLNLPNSLTTIGYRAFNDNELTSVTFMLDVNNKSNIQEIGRDAFSNNDELTSIALPNHATGADVTYKDSEDKVYQPGDLFSEFSRSLVGILPPYTLTWNDINIDDQGVITECNCDNFLSRNIIIPKSVNKLLDGGGVEPITIKGIRNEFPGVFHDKSLQSITFANDSEVTTIGYNAFKDNYLTALSLPASVVTIGDNAFKYNNIKTLNLSEGIKTIGDDAFWDNNIETLSLPASLISIEKWAFGSNKLKEVTFRTDENNKSNIQNIWNDAFSRNDELTSIALPNHATGVDVTYKDSEGKVYNSGDTFSNFDRSLVGILPPYTLTWNDISIDGQGVITECNCDNFLSRNIIIPKSVNKPLDGGGMETITIKGIRNDFSGVFSYKSLQSITFANDSEVTTIGYNTFKYNYLTALSLPASVVTIGEGAFSDNNIETLTLPNRINTISSYAFWYNNIETLSLPTSLISIGERAFSSNELKEVTFITDEKNKSQIQEIESNAFSNNNELVGITLPEHINGDKVGFEYKDSEGVVYTQGSIFREFDRSLTSEYYPKVIITSISGESIGSNTPYPNPVQSYLKVDTHKGEQVQILNQEGVMVYSAQITQDEVHTIPVDTLPAGMYLVRITDAEGNTTTKRIVKK